MNTVPESHRDLLASDVAVLATVGPDGYPQVTALWFLLDEDGALKLSLNTAGSGATELVVQRARPGRPRDRIQTYQGGGVAAMVRSRPSRAATCGRSSRLRKPAGSTPPHPPEARLGRHPAGRGDCAGRAGRGGLRV